MIVEYTDIQQAKKRIEPYINKTAVNEISDGVFLKLENTQPVVKGFKIRGAASAMTAMTDKVVMTSALGTHGFAVGYIGKQLGIETICMMIKNPPKAGEAKMKELVDTVMHGLDTFAETEQYAQEYAKKEGIHFIHPYNDKQVVAGQGTIGLELLEQLPDIGAVYVPIGGGGLIAGIAIAIKKLKSDIQVIGVQPQAMHAMVSAVEYEKITPVEVRTSQAEKLAVNLNPQTITFDLVKHYVDYYLLLTEEEIKSSMKEIYEKTGEIVEGAGAIAYAAVNKDEKKYNTAVCIVSGGNISKQDFTAAIQS